MAERTQLLEEAEDVVRHEMRYLKMASIYGDWRMVMDRLETLEDRAINAIRQCRDNTNFLQAIVANSDTPDITHSAFYVVADGPPRRKYDLL